jgi:hypothetical protein
MNAAGHIPQKSHQVRGQIRTELPHPSVILHFNRECTLCYGLRHDKTPYFQNTRLLLSCRSIQNKQPGRPRSSLRGQPSVHQLKKKRIATSSLPVTTDSHYLPFSNKNFSLSDHTIGLPQGPVHPVDSQDHRNMIEFRTMPARNICGDIESHGLPI